jgi:hypothetical protein
LVGPLNFSKNGSLSLMLGLDWNFKLTDKLSTIGNIGKSVIVLEGGSASDIDGGASFTIRSKTKQKEVKVVLSASDRTYQTGSQEVREQEMTFISTTGSYLKKTKVRGGILLHNAVLEAANFAEPSKLSQFGLFGGLEFSSQYHVKSQVKKVKGITSGLNRFYIDGMVLPVNKNAGVGMGLGLGAKAGFWLGLNPNKGKSNFQAFPKMYWKSELGIRPQEGWFFMMGAGLLIFNNK